MDEPHGEHTFRHRRRAQPPRPTHRKDLFTLRRGPPCLSHRIRSAGPGGPQRGPPQHVGLHNPLKKATITTKQLPSTNKKTPSPGRHYGQRGGAADDDAPLSPPSPPRAVSLSQLRHLGHGYRAVGQRAHAHTCRTASLPAARCSPRVPSPQAHQPRTPAALPIPVARCASPPPSTASMPRLPF